MLNENGACVPDLINPKILTELQAKIVLPLVDYFSQSLQDGGFPLVWKQANLCPTSMKVDRADPANYRPGSLTLCICRNFRMHDTLCYL